MITEEEKNETGLEIAVIGMAGRFPEARDIHQFWDNLKKGVESIKFFNDEELKKAGVNPTLLDDSKFIKSSGAPLENIE